MRETRKCAKQIILILHPFFHLQLVICFLFIYLFIYFLFLLLILFMVFLFDSDVLEHQKEMRFISRAEAEQQRSRVHNSQFTIYNSQFKNLFLLIAAALITYLPMAWYFATHPAQFSARASSVMVQVSLTLASTLGKVSHADAAVHISDCFWI